ncbi:MAG: zinc ribbon domain-containing protein [Candidatus Bipolaricaulia bacterium]
MAEFCHSCTMPLDSPEARGASDIYCKYCSDEAGNLKSRGEVQLGIASWLRSWQEGITEEQATRRAEHFMQAMPAWAED